MKQIAYWLSIALHPVVMLLLVSFIVVSHATHSSRSAYWWTLYAGVFFILLCLFIAWGVRRKIFTDLDVSYQPQRKILYIAAASLSLLYLMGLIVLKAPSILFLLAAAILGLIGALAVVNRHIKASGHVACVSVLATTIIMIYGTVALPSLLLIPIVAWSRIRLGRHSLAETSLGAIIGIALVLLMVSLIGKV